MVNSDLLIPNYLYINLAPLEKGMPRVCKEGTGEIEVVGYMADFWSLYVVNVIQNGNQNSHS